MSREGRAVTGNGPELDFHPVADIFPMMSDREFADLTEDVRAHGLLEPVWLHGDGRIIDGRNRYRACLAAGVEPQFRTYEGTDDELTWFVVSLNLHRRHLNESQRAMSAARAEEFEQGRPRKDANLHLNRSRVAEQFQVSPRSVASAKKVQTSAVPELADEVASGKVSVSTAATLAEVSEEEQRETLAAADTVAEQQEDTAKREREREKAIVRAANEIKRRRKEERQREKAAKVAEIAARAPAPLIALGPFPVIYADPPWRYDYAEDTSRQIENHYPTMSLDEIKALDVPASDDAVIFLWVTSPKLVEGLEVLAAWGFDYRTSMVWVKDKIGMGYYARQQHELLLIGKRGALPVPDPEDRPPSVIEAPRGMHSSKPDRVYELLERMYPFAEKCELFQRRPRDGWAGWGNQAEAS